MLQLFDFELTADEMAQLYNLNKNFRNYSEQM